MTQPIILPLVAMMFLTIIVAIVMYRRRVSAMKSERIHPQKVHSRKGGLEHFADTRASDNYMNLFELPVLFYVAILTIMLTNNSSHLIVALAWAFVAFRAAHSIIHCTYNKVMHRFVAFMLSFITLTALWLVLASNLMLRTQF